MVILYGYLRKGSNIVGCLPFRYNIEDIDKIEARELILDLEPGMTYDAVMQHFMKIVDKEKMDNGELTDDLSGDVSGVVTIE
jgi:hypothetical protein